MKGSSRRAKKIGLGLVGLACVQVAVVYAYRAIQDRRPAGAVPARFEYERLTLPPRGLDAPLLTPAGRVTTLRESIGKPVLVHFWATWCEPCRDELPKLLEFGHERNVRIALVSVDESWEVVRHFFEGKLPPEVLLDGDRGAREAFGVSTLPDTYLLDEAGRPTARFHGPREWSGEGARAAVQRLLAGAH